MVARRSLLIEEFKYLSSTVLGSDKSAYATGEICCHANKNPTGRLYIKKIRVYVLELHKKRNLRLESREGFGQQERVVHL